MVSFAEKLAAAKKIERPHTDVTVALRSDLTEKRVELEARQEDLASRVMQAQTEAERDPRLTHRPNAKRFQEEHDRLVEDAAKLDAEEADASLATLRFWELPGDEWIAITMAYPPRADVALDENRGYNVHAASKDAAQVNGRVVEGDELIELTGSQWADLWDQLPGRALSLVCDAVFDLNEFNPQVRLSRLGKASPVAPDNSPGSPE